MFPAAERHAGMPVTTCVRQSNYQWSPLFLFVRRLSYSVIFCNASKNKKSKALMFFYCYLYLISAITCKCMYVYSHLWVIFKACKLLFFIPWASQSRGGNGQISTNSLRSCLNTSFLYHSTNTFAIPVKLNNKMLNLFYLSLNSILNWFDYTFYVAVLVVASPLPLRWVLWVQIPRSTIICVILLWL